MSANYGTVYSGVGNNIPYRFDPNMVGSMQWNTNNPLLGSPMQFWQQDPGYDPYSPNNGSIYNQGLYNQGVSNQGATNYLYGMQTPGPYSSMADPNSPYAQSLNLALSNQQATLDFKKQAFDLLKGFLNGSTNGANIPQADPHSFDSQIQSAQNDYQTGVSNAQNQFMNNSPQMVDTSQLQALAGGPSNAAYNAMRGQALQGLNQQFKTSMNSLAGMQGRGAPKSTSQGMTSDLLNSNLMANASLNQGLQGSMYNQHLAGAGALMQGQGMNQNTQYNMANSLLGSGMTGAGNILNSGMQKASIGSSLMGQNLGLAGQAYNNQLTGAFQSLGQLLQG